MLGAGLAGLTLADALVQRGREAVVLEKLSQVGGLARTVRRDGFAFDLGGHRFHSAQTPPIAWLKRLMGEELLTVPRKSCILYEGRFISYPLQLRDALAHFGLARSVRAGFSYFRGRLGSSRAWAARSFENKIISRFGRELYKAYFQPYTEKVWGIPCDRLSAEWADERIAIPSLAQAVARSFSKNGAAKSRSGTQFLYPARGAGSVCERLAERISASGRGRIALDVSSVELTTGERGAEVRFASADRPERLPCERVVSTIPIHALACALGSQAEQDAASKLAYRDLVCVLLTLKRPSMTQYSWIYTPDRGIVFGRLHEPGNWSRALVPADEVCSVCAEVFCSAGDSVWQMADGELAAQVVAHLAATGLVRREEIDRCYVERAAGAYPVYECGYERALGEFNTLISARPRLHLLGRTGSFRYLNMDAVIAEALAMAEQIGGWESRSSE